MSLNIAGFLAKGDGAILVGTYDNKKNKSSFSNYGKCVDYYMLGSSVVVAAPKGFLDVADGASFSAPLMTRYLSLNWKPGEKISRAISQLDSSSDTNGYMSMDSNPIEIAYRDDNEIGSYTLTSGSFVHSTLMSEM